MKPVIRYHFAENKTISGLTETEANAEIPFPCNLLIRCHKGASRILPFQFNGMELLVQSALLWPAKACKEMAERVALYSTGAVRNRHNMLQ